MAQNLECRRLAIAEALRAVMAEPLRAVPTGSDHAITVMPLQANSPVVTALRRRPTATVLPAGAEQLALDVDHVAATEPTEAGTAGHPDPSPAHNDAAFHTDPHDDPVVDAGTSADIGTAIDLDSDGDSDTDTQAARRAGSASRSGSGSDPANIPPIDTIGSMSRVASLALFGHA